jgi:hypothetical protein
MAGWKSGFMRGGSMKLKVGKKKAGKKGITKHKKEAWTEFSRMIRLRYSDHTGQATCVTCGVVKPWGELQAGHFLDGRRNATLFDERNVHPQCVKCNMFNGGSKVSYYRFMLMKYGQEVIDDLMVLDKQERKFTADELIDMKEKYKMRQAGYMAGGVLENIDAEIPY